MLDIDNYILVFQCIVKMAETFWPLALIAIPWFFSELRHQDKSRV